MRCPTCGRENPPEARFCMECGRPLPAGSPGPFLPILLSLLILGLLGGLIALIPVLSAGTAVREQREGTTGRRLEAGPAPSPSPASTPTPAYTPITAESVSGLRRVGQLRLTPRGGGRWLPSGDWKVWAEISGNRVYVHRLGGSEVTLIEAPDTLSAVAVAPDGSRIAAGLSADRLMLWEAVNGEVLMDQEIPVDIPGAGRAGVYPPLWSFERQIRSLAFSPEGRYLAACCPKGRGTEGQMETIWIYDARAGALLGALDAQVLGFAWGSEDQLWLIYRAHPSWGGSVSLAVLRVPSMEVQPLLDLPGLEKLIIAPDGSRIAAFLDPQRVQIFSLPDGRAGPRIEVPGPIGFGEEVRAAFTPDGRLLITESNGTLRFWRTDDGRRVHLIDGAGRLIGVSPDGLWIATEEYGAPAIWATSTASSRSTPTPAPAQPTATPTAAPKEIIFGMLLVGPYNDRGWSQAHYEAGQYVERKLPGAKMLYIDKVNPADRPATTAFQLAEELAAKGAKVIIFNSDDHKDEAIKFAKAHPDIVVIHASGDDAWKEGKNYKGIPNLANVMGQMEYGKMIAGCAAALTTRTGKIGYLGPLINDETRRLAASAYLGAKYCWEKYLGKPAKDLKFKVTWIGFWFHIPGVTADPTQVAQDFINSGYDVIISGIDTTEALREAAKATQAGKKVWAIPYDYIGACEEAPDVCLGVPYFNWGPSYLAHIQAVLEGTWKPSWDWVGPDWKDINNPDTSHVGFLKGKALSPEASAKLDEFIKGLGDGSIQLWKGPIRLQDGTLYVEEGKVATPQQIWYLPQLLEGMEGQSVK